MATQPWIPPIRPITNPLAGGLNLNDANPRPAVGPQQAVGLKKPGC